MLVTLLVACSSSSSMQIAPMKLFPIADGEKFGYADLEGNIVIKPQFDRAYMFRDGVALVGVGTGKDTRWGYVKEDGTVLSEPTYIEATQFNEGLAWIVKEDGYPIAIDTKGQVQIEAKDARSVRCFSDGLAAFCVEEKPYHYLWGFMNTSGKTVIEPQFKNVGEFSEGLAAVKTELGWNYIDKKGNVVIRNVPNEIPERFHNGRIVVKAGDYRVKGLYDNSGKQVLPFEYIQIIPDGDLFLFTATGIRGWMDKNGKTVISVEDNVSDNITCFYGAEQALFSKGGKWGYINRQGKVSIPAQFDRAFPFSGDHALVLKDQRVGVINEKGEYIVEPKFGHSAKYYSALEVYGSDVVTYPGTANVVTTRYIDPELLANPRITPKGVGPITLGMNISDIPKSVKYLYDNMVVEQVDDMGDMITFVKFYWKGQEVMAARSWDNKTLAGIGVGFESSRASNPVYFQADDLKCHLTDSFRRYASNHNLKETTVESAGGPVKYYNVQGVKIYTVSGSVTQFEIGEYLLLWD